MGYNILVVDDSQTTRLAIKRIIKILKIPVEQFFEATNGQMGIEILYHNPVDFILLDIKMPVMDGIEMARKVKEDEKFCKTPIIFISSHKSDLELEKARELGVNAFIQKPFDPQKFKEIVDHFIQNQTNNYDHLFYKSIKKVVETTFFTLAKEICPGNIFEILPSFKDKAFYWISLSFNGDVQGNIEFYIPLDLSNKLVRYLLGLDEIVNVDSLLEDNLKEFTNIICGHFLSDNFSHQIYHAQFPTIQKETFIPEKVMDYIDEWKIVEIENQFFLYKLIFFYKT